MLNYKHCLQKVVALIATMLVALNLCSQQNLYQFNQLDSRKGLSNNQVNSIFQDEKGFIWFGTMSGLNRYDGYNFKIFRHKPGDSTFLNDDYINHIVQGPHHTLWVLTPNGWNIFNPCTEKFSTNIAAFVKIPSASENLADVVQDKQGSFWFVYPGKGLYKYVADTKALLFFNAATSSSKLHSNNIHAVSADGLGFVDGV